MFGWFKRLGSKVVGSVKRLGRKVVGGAKRVGHKVSAGVKRFGHGVGSGLRKAAGKFAKYGSVAAAGMQIGGAALAATVVGLPLAAAMETGAVGLGIASAGAGLTYKLLS